jgi:hypothetical protein
MSEVKLNLVDAHSIRVGTVHGSVADASVAALTADPETIAELEKALARYIKPDENYSQFASFNRRDEIDAEPSDAGIVIIDLAARVVAAESTYSQPGPEGQVEYHNGRHGTDVPIGYLLDSSWLFVNSAESYRWSAARRRFERQAILPLDARAVLYGQRMLEFILKFASELRAKGFALPPRSQESIGEIAGAIVKAHAAWLTSPRGDLRGRAPRDVMLEKRHFIGMDLESRALQWSMLGEGPPCLPLDSHAYRYAGFGTHEWVVYYDLVRYLLSMSTIGSSSENTAGQFSEDISTSFQTHAIGNVTSDAVASVVREYNPLMIEELERLKCDWLESAQDKYDGRTPAVIIDNERRRLPITMTPDELMIDEDCECCRMLAREAKTGCPTFWYLDSCHVEDEFAFSTCLTIQEWEAENRRREELELEFARRNWENEEQQRDFDRQMLESELYGEGPEADAPALAKYSEDWEPLQLTDHEMVDFVEQLRRGDWPPRKPRRIEEEDGDQNSQRTEPVN